LQIEQADFGFRRAEDFWRCSQSHAGKSLDHVMKIIWYFLIFMFVSMLVQDGKYGERYQSTTDYRLEQ
jgi:hypothetical protein